MRPQIRLLAVAVAASIACSFCAIARADDAAAPVRAALGKLDSWLGSGKNAQAWDKYLDLTALRAQLKLGNQADREALAQVQKQLASGANGLELKQFARLRTALDTWIAQLEIAQAPSLSAAVLGAESRFRPITAADVSQAKASLEQATDKLDGFLSGENGAAWKKYLGFSDLETQLALDVPDIKTLAGVYQKLTSDQVGLEMPVFANVATALEGYVNDYVGHQENLQEQYGEQLKKLAAALEEYAQNPSNENAIGLGKLLGWLENMRQAPLLVAAVREQISQPNLKVVASERLLGAGIAQNLDENTPVDDYILGTDINGTGHMVADVRAELVPSEQRAMFDTMLSGLVRSRTVGYNGPATIYSNGATAISGRKRIVIDANGFSSYPATAAANTNTRVTGIGGGRIVQRVASRRVGEQKPQAERIAADHAADRVRRRMDEQIGEQLSQAHSDYLNKVRNPLVRRREFPALRFSTSDESLLLIGTAANRNQIAASTAPPEITVKNDLAARIHQSMVNNLCAALLAGRKLTEEELQQSVTDLLGKLPESLESDPDRDPWSITFARSQPLTVKFDDAEIEITIRGQRYTSGERDFRAMNVTAKYKYEIDGPGIKLTRQGDLNIVPPGKPRPLSGREITLRTLLEKRFGKLFEPEVKYEGLVLPGRWREAGILDLKQITAENGWMALAWIESGVPAPPKEDEQPSTDKQPTDRVTQASS